MLERKESSKNTEEEDKPKKKKLEKHINPEYETVRIEQSAWLKLKKATAEYDFGVSQLLNWIILKLDQDKLNYFAKNFDSKIEREKEEEKEEEKGRREEEDEDEDEYVEALESEEKDEEGEEVKRY